MDILVYNPNRGSFAKWYSDGTVRPDFNYQPVGRVGLPIPPDGNTQLIPVDFNGDRNTDIMVYNPTHNYFAKWYSDGSVRPDFDYQSVGRIGLPSWDQSTQMIPMDFNGDGDMDILVYNPKDAYFAKWYSDASIRNDFTYEAAVKIGLQYWDRSTQLMPVDFNADGNTDIMIFNPRYGSFAKWYGAGNVIGIEVSQSIQNMGHVVPLIAGKTTWVRVYPKTKLSTPTIIQGILHMVNELTGESATVTSISKMTVDPANNGQMQQKRENIQQSLNFLIPAQFSAEGAFRFNVASVTDESGKRVQCSNCGSSRLVSFKTVAPLRVRMVGIQYTTGSGPSLVQNAPRPIDFTFLQSWLTRAYPTGQVLATQITVTSTNSWVFTCNQANGQLAAMRNNEISNNTVDARTHYIGLVSNSGGFMRGCAAGIPSFTAAAPTGPTAGGLRPVNIPGDNDATFGDWYGGHELGHTYGRSHPGFCPGNSADDNAFPYPNGQISTSDGDFTGLDVGDATNTINAIVIPGESNFDIMTYCNQPQWLSYYTYQGILDDQVTEDPSASGAPSATAGLRPLQRSTTDFINIIATANLSRKTATIVYVNHLQNAPRQKRLERGRASIRLLDANHKTLGIYKVVLNVNTDRQPGEDSTALIDAIIPNLKGIHTIELLFNGKVTDHRVASKNKPVVNNFHFTQAEKKFNDTAVVDLSWAGRDADGDSLSYMVEIRAKDGKWETIAIGLRSPEIQLSTQLLKERNWTELRIIANDGFNSSAPVYMSLQPKK
jgi:hypothetical protein